MTSKNLMFSIVMAFVLTIAALSEREGVSTQLNGLAQSTTFIDENLPTMIGFARTGLCLNRRPTFSGLSLCQNVGLSSARILNRRKLSL
jgi:hypothetical protein